MSTLLAAPRARLPRLAGNALEAARLTLVPQQRPTRSRGPFVVLVAGVLLAGVVGLLMFNTSMQHSSFRLTALEAKAATLRAQEQGLLMELDRLRDPQRVAGRAQAMGMVPMVNLAFIDLEDGAVLGNPAPALAADAQRLTPLPTRRPAGVRPPTTQTATPATPRAASAAGAPAAAAGERAGDGAPSAEEASERGTKKRRAAGTD